MCCIIGLIIGIILGIYENISRKILCKNEFKKIKIGDRYATILTDAEDVFTKPEYIYVEITDKKEKDSIYFVQYKFDGTNNKTSERFDEFLKIYFKLDGKNTYN